MTGAARWPLHPHPGAGEALSSWLIRVADAYGEDAAADIAVALGW